MRPHYLHYKTSDSCVNTFPVYPGGYCRDGSLQPSGADILETMPSDASTAHYHTAAPRAPAQICIPTVILNASLQISFSED